MKKICVITGTRAEYGLLRPVIEKISMDKEFELQLIATGMHLSTEFGLTYKEIEEDGINIDEKIEILLSSDSSIGVSKSMGLAMISFAEAYERLKPDLILALGDRYEIFAAVSAASVAKIPVAHLHGGETTEGAFDEAFRHSITKMSHLHFTSTETYRNRVIQLGEHPKRVFYVGSLGVENVKGLKLLEKDELEQSINFKFDKKIALITYHPETLDNNPAIEQIQALIKALDKIEDIKLIFTKSNSDTNGRIINQVIDEYVKKNIEKAIVFSSMGQVRYLSAMKHCSIVIGNSSSGIIEAPSFKVPTVNIGDRQKGRIKADSIIDCLCDTNDIAYSIEKGLSYEFNKNLCEISNPYEKYGVSENIVDIIKNVLFKETLDIKKKFYDL